MGNVCLGNLCLRNPYNKIELNVSKLRKITEQTEQHLKHQQELLSQQEQGYVYELDLLTSKINGLIKYQHQCPKDEARAKALVFLQQKKLIASHLNRVRNRMLQEQRQSMELLQMISNKEMLLHNAELYKGIATTGISKKHIEHLVSQTEKMNEDVTEMNAEVNDLMEDAANATNSEHGLQSDEELIKELDELFEDGGVDGGVYNLNELPNIVSKNMNIGSVNRKIVVAV